MATGFYDEMADMASDLLAPTSMGGLGQGEIKLVRTTYVGEDPETPWEPGTPSVQTETLRGAARGVKSQLVGTEAGGTVILATDRQVIAAVPRMGYEAGDTMMIDGKSVQILAVQNIPAAGTPAAVRFIVRG